MTMTTVSIHLPDELRAELSRRAAQAGYQTVEAYVEGLVRADIADRDYGAPAHLSPANRAEFEALVQDGLNSPAVEVGPRHWQDLKDELIAKHGDRKGR